MTEQEYIDKIVEFRDTMIQLRDLYQTNPIWSMVNGEIFIAIMEKELSDPQATESNIAKLPEMAESLIKTEELLDKFAPKSNNVSA